MFFYRGKYNTNIFLNFFKLFKIFWFTNRQKKDPLETRGLAMVVESDRLRKTTHSSLGLPLVERHQVAPMLVVLSKNESVSNSGGTISVHSECDIVCLWSLHTSLICGQIGYLSINISLFLVIWRFLFHFLYFAFFNSLFISPKQIHFSLQCNI